MNTKPIRVVIRQPLHGLIQHWAEILGLSDYGEVVNFLLLDLKRSGYQPGTAEKVEGMHHLQPKQGSSESSDISDLAGLF